MLLWDKLVSGSFVKKLNNDKRNAAMTCHESTRLSYDSRFIHKLQLHPNPPPSPPHNHITNRQQFLNLVILRTKSYTHLELRPRDFSSYVAIREGKHRGNVPLRAIARRRYLSIDVLGQYSTIVARQAWNNRDRFYSLATKSGRSLKPVQMYDYSGSTDGWRGGEEKRVERRDNRVSFVRVWTLESSGNCHLANLPASHVPSGRD
ncbi:hypothetical protein J6590_060481 [Homalodisca vitripennis]|nr:hypothetical protein J6590_060481 [Homalodisca vitripennis]